MEGLCPCGHEPTGSIVPGCKICLTLNKKMMMEELANTERRILRKILGPIKKGDQYRRRHNNELYKHIEKITDSIRKRRIAFYGHLQRMDSNRLTGRIFKYIRKLKMANTWINETENNEELQITHGDITKRRPTPLRNKLHNFKRFQAKREEKQELFGLRKGERKTGKEWERYRGEGKKEGRKEAVKANVFHSGLFDIKI